MLLCGRCVLRCVCVVRLRLRVCVMALCVARFSAFSVVLMCLGCCLFVVVCVHFCCVVMCVRLVCC